MNDDIQVWPDPQGRTSWLGRFLDYMKAHGRMDDFTFLSFEHYPYEPCKVQWSSLYDEPSLISHIVEVWRGDGLPPNFPLFITELNIAWNTGESFVNIFGGLWLADFVGSYLEAGGDALYYFHYLPVGLYHGCNGSMGTFGLFTVTPTTGSSSPHHNSSQANSSTLSGCSQAPASMNCSQRRVTSWIPPATLL